LCWILTKYTRVEKVKTDPKRGKGSQQVIEEGDMAPWQDRKMGRREEWPARRSTMVVEEGSVAGQKDGQRKEVEVANQEG
jgi:hypothetical protein